MGSSVEAISPLPPEEQSMVEPFVGAGVRVLEFGNKRSPGAGTPENPRGAYSFWYREKGCHYVSVDINGQDGAMKIDVRNRFDLSKGEIVTNFGFSEHVTIQKPFWQNALAHLEVGGHFVNAVPQPNQWLNHGYSYWHPEYKFFLRLAYLNALTIEDHYAYGNEGKRLWAVVLKKQQEAPFRWDDCDNYFWRNKNWPIK